ncbi:DUF1127 domain-containing protein [Devosia sp.]|uniref:DUF1127 domain-containing protein n=1 Tax=Devosia sp. TaxID=1871048 RepID=UPI002FC5DF98
MTVIDSGVRLHARPRFFTMRGFRRLLVRLRQHRRAAQTHIALSRLDPRLLYDIGLEPLDLYAVHKASQPPSMLLDTMRKQFVYRDKEQSE